MGKKEIPNKMNGTGSSGGLGKLDER